MKIFDDISQVVRDKNTILTIGTFDGFHIGHQKIIDQVIKDAAAGKSRSFVITFEPHPRIIVSKNYNIKILTTLDEKIELLKARGIQNLLVIKFTPEFSKLTSDEFFQNYINGKVGVSEIVLGHDHRFGRDRGGDENKLRELGESLGFKVVPVSAVKTDSNVISSTLIRNTLSEGKISEANKFLGRFYSFSGVVVKGSMRGRLLGFPTANLHIADSSKLIPPHGIYVTEIIHNAHRHYGVMSIGVRPTFETNGQRTIEIYILDFKKDIYGETLKINVIEKIRDEIKFSSKDELIARMHDDVRTGIEILNRYKVYN